MNKVSEFGRSMIEMLGVLAIIGVLSILGIAGYKKAMNKYRANELIHLLMMVYNQAQAKAVFGRQSELMGNLSGSVAKDALRAEFTLYLTSSSHAGSTGIVGNMGVEPPAFINHPDFNIRVKLIPDESLSYLDQTYYRFSFYGLNGNCDLCEALKSNTTWVKNKKFRYLPLPKNGKITSYVVDCYPTDGSDTETSCWKTTDTE